MSQPGAKASVAILDAKELRRASITSLFEPWARAENLRLISFTPEQAHEALQADTDVRMLIFNIGGESVAERENLQQLKVLRALASKVPLVIISDRDDANDIACAGFYQQRNALRTRVPNSIFHPEWRLVFSAVRDASTSGSTGTSRASSWLFQ